MAELTSVEVETLRLLADGLTTPEIASKVYMSLGAIKSRVTRIRAKLGAETQAHAVALAYQQGILVRADDEHGEAVHALAAVLRRAGYRLAHHTLPVVPLDVHQLRAGETQGDGS